MKPQGAQRDERGTQRDERGTQQAAGQRERRGSRQDSCSAWHAERVIRSGRVLLVPAGDQAPGGREVAPQAGRLVLGDRCFVASDDASLVETQACGTYLRVDRATRLDTGEGPAVVVEPGLYQVIRTQA